MLEILRACDCCRLGLVDGKEAYIVPLNFGYEIQKGCIILYFHCAQEGRKMDLLPQQSLVSFEMDTKHELTRGKLGCEFSYLYQSIMGTGILRVVDDESEKIHGLKQIMVHYTDRAQWQFDEELVKRTAVLTLSVKKWSCKEH